MKTIKLIRYIELLLFALLAIFPFSFEKLTLKWNVLLGIILGVLVFSLLFKRVIMLGDKVMFSIIPLVFLVIFDFSENVNFSQLFNIQNPIGWRIPFSTIILSLAMLVFMIKLFLEGKFVLSIPLYLKYIAMSFLFLCILMGLFYPIMHLNYNMGMGSNIQLLTKIVKYSFLILIILSLPNNKSHLKRLNTGLVLSIGAGLVLSIIF